MPFTRTDYNADANTTTDRENKREEKMSNMKCPFCQQELECCGIYIDGTKKLWCDNCKLFGDNRLFEKLIRTRKALDKAMWWLNEIVESHRCTPISTAEMALKEITALEQKE